jgi:hypothetical protein
MGNSMNLALCDLANFVEIWFWWNVESLWEGIADQSEDL